MLTKQKALLGTSALEESNKVREPRRTALLPVSQFQVLWWRGLPSALSLANHLARAHILSHPGALLGGMCISQLRWFPMRAFLGG